VVIVSIKQKTENIGVRRLHTMLERVLNEVSFDVSDRADKEIEVNADYVRKQLGDVAEDEDLSRHIL
jgi:ATP-dependent HslUV protease ATP-binding subunit HslU